MLGYIFLVIAIALGSFMLGASVVSLLYKQEIKEVWRHVREWEDCAETKSAQRDYWRERFETIELGDKSSGKAPVTRPPVTESTRPEVG